QPGVIALRLVCAGAIRAIRLAMIDPLHLEGRMKIIPSPCLVGMDNAPSGDAPADDRHGLGLMLHDICHRLAATLAHDHDTYVDGTLLARAFRSVLIRSLASICPASHEGACVKLL